MRRRTHKASPVQLELTGTRTGIEAPSALSRWSTSRDAKAETPAPKPWLAVVLAVDTARMSGWSIALRGKYMCSGELDTLDEAIVEQVVSNACALSTEHRVPVVMVLEAPWGGSPNIVAMLGAARERWLRAWRCAEQASARVVYVQPNQWRGVVLGRPPRKPVVSYGTTFVEIASACRVDYQA